MTCADRREALLAYLEQELGSTERADLEAHLAGCEACRLALEAERRLSGALASLPAVEPSRDFEARFWARIAREKDAPVGWRRRLFTWRLALALGGAAAAVVAVVLAVRAPSEPDVDLQIVANSDEDYEILEDPDLDVIEVSDVLEQLDGDQG
jgi:anti-sigma factor RsiW